MSQVGVMHLVDTLEAGGRERVVVNLANLMPRERFSMHVCTTRRDGPLVSALGKDVGYLCLHRLRTFERRAIRHLLEAIREHDIQILHAHGTALVMACFASLFPPYPTIVWHDHFGTNERRERSAWLYRLLTRRVRMVLTVSQPLADWARDRLRLPAQRVRCFPNFVVSNTARSRPLDLPGRKGSRIVCVANLRPAKDHLNLLAAAQQIVHEFPTAHLLLVGAMHDREYGRQIQRTIVERNLQSHVSVLGARNDVSDILAACDIGVLSSRSEGFPVSLLEYGAAGLPVVVTEVGQCAEVLDQGRAGMLVPPNQPRPLASAMLTLLRSEEERTRLGTALQQRIRNTYDAESVINSLETIYASLLQTSGSCRA